MLKLWHGLLCRLGRHELWVSKPFRKNDAWHTPTKCAWCGIERERVS